MDKLKILFHGEARLADWGETRSGGKYIKLFLSEHDGDPLINFRPLDTVTLKKSGHVFNLTISQGDIIATDEEPVNPTKPYGHTATKLYSGGFFFVPNVLKCIGSDQSYREWLQKQPSVYSGEFSEYVNGEGRCIAAHVRRSGEAGTAYKPQYSCIPLTNDEHTLQHQQGESALTGLDWEKQKNKYLVEWAKTTLSAMLGYSSMGYVVPKELASWCKANDLEQYLPRAYRET